MIQWITLAMGLADKILDKTPDYDQKQRRRYDKIKEEYQKQMAVDYPFRDDLLVDDLRDQLRRHIESIIKAI